MAWIKVAEEVATSTLRRRQDLSKKTDRVTAAGQARRHTARRAKSRGSRMQGRWPSFPIARTRHQADLYLSRLDGSPARRLTELKGYVEAPAFSPDGTAWLFCMLQAQRGQPERWRP